MKTNDLKYVAQYVCGFLTMLAIWAGCWIASSYFEAQSFNRVTGKNVSTWDAMFIELRVQEAAK